MQQKYTEEFLNGLLKSRVKSIAKSLNIQGESKWTKKKYIQEILSSNLNVNNTLPIDAKPNWFKSIIDDKIRVILIIIVSIISISTFVYSAFDLELAFKKMEDKNKTNKLKIAVLPLSPDRDCNIEDTKFEQLILDRLNSIDRSFEIEAIYLDYENCIRSDSTAKIIAGKYNCDIAIWGFYDEKCLEDTKIRLRYTTVNPNNLFYENYKGDSKYRNVEDLSFLRNGELTRDIEYVVSYFAMINAYRNGKYRLVINEFDEIKPDNCNEEFLCILSKSHYYLGDIISARIIAEEAQDCLKNNYKNDRIVIDSLKRIAAGKPDSLLIQDKRFYQIHIELSELAFHRYMYYHYMGEGNYLKELGASYDTGNLSFEESIELNRRVNLMMATKYHEFSKGNFSKNYSQNNAPPSTGPNSN